MKRKASVAIVLTLVLIGLMLSSGEAYALKSYCDPAYFDCLGKCGTAAGWITGATSLFGNGWIGFLWGGGCAEGCTIGWAMCVSGF
ncbi:MAG: hypothetical protein AB1428_08875 [Bacteroidota bacterium]